MIREAEIKDFDRILELCAEFWTHTQFTEPFEPEHTRAMVGLALDHGLLAVLVVDGVIEGFAAGVKSPLLGNSTVLVGTELAWWVNPLLRGSTHGVRLLQFMELLAFNQGIKYWNMASMQSSMPEQVNRMYEKMGYEHSETTYTKVMM